MSQVRTPPDRPVREASGKRRAESTATEGPTSTATSDNAERFADRHLGPSTADQQAMLTTLGFASLEDLVDAAVPGVIRRGQPLSLPEARSETEALASLRDLGARNKVFTSLIGMGYYDTITPPVIQRNVLENPAWYTAYTPYQPEISQGRLEALLNFQTMVSDLTGMDLANASLLDEATAAAEAMALCHRVHRGSAGTFLVDARCHPQTIAVVRTRAEPLGIRVVVCDPRAELERRSDGSVRARVDSVDGDAFGVLVQYPAGNGELEGLRPVVEAAHEANALVAVAADLLALVLVESPGAAGADVVVGSAQRFGVPLGYGGPHAGYMAVREGLARQLPGRLVGVSVDTAGRPALRLALQTREQHIRREKATSNICTAQVLPAVMAGLYACYHGPDGLTRIARRVHCLTARLAYGLRRRGVDVTTPAYFDTITVSVPGRAEAIARTARDRRINLRVVDADTLGVSLDETTTDAVVVDVWSAFESVLGAVRMGASGDRRRVERDAALDAEAEAAPTAIPTGLVRRDEFLTHPVFHRHHSETEMLRYLRRLADRDLALDRTMIPLGSCTMKLNATTEMLPVTWPEFSRLHPFAPRDQAEGYRELFADLERWLCDITGYDAVSLQPNAGSQGELAGLLAIRAYHHDRGELGRDVCLIPSSAHGTNAASASLAGLRVVVVACDDDGNVDLADLESKAKEHAARLCAAMVTYPSTHGVFEATITTVCDVVHRHGGQVYLDGANLNALVGVAAPGTFGADVSHLNLHKTFCIPHGGGGPGVGPVAVRAHLAPYLPGHPVVPESGPASPSADGGVRVGPVSAAPWGSAGILPISWAYVAMMGPDGLTRATQVALLNANYVARRLADAFPVLYTGARGLVAHECIVDLRPITQATGVTVDDVAKRLVDYGFHAPTVSFPVPGTLMIEPTESEDRRELDRFCEAMIAIRSEIEDVSAGRVPLEVSVLRRAPHTAEDLLGDTWTRPYTRAEAAFPGRGVRGDKYWPPVSRIDSAYGDRNIMCSCPPVEAYGEP